MVYSLKDSTVSIQNHQNRTQRYNKEHVRGSGYYTLPPLNKFGPPNLFYLRVETNVDTDVAFPLLFPKLRQFRNVLAILLLPFEFLGFRSVSLVGPKCGLVFPHKLAYHLVQSGDNQ